MTQHSTNRDEQKISAIALSLIASPGGHGLWERIPGYSPSAIYAEIASVRIPPVQGFIAERYIGDPRQVAQRIHEKCRMSAIGIVDFWDPAYPPLLREIYRPPLVLYVRGRLGNRLPIAIVGTRKADQHSSLLSRRIAAELSHAGACIVSGMALGIDREAHRGALQAGGSTIGVLANGIDVLYPAANRDLHNDILASEQSCLMSEYPPGIIAGKWTFVRRNRIISGLSRGVVVVQAGLRSGALLTARHAIEQNREVFACPGPACHDAYAGCHTLIRSGAILVSCVEDILQEYRNASASSPHCAAQPLLFPEGESKKNSDCQTQRRPYTPPIDDPRERLIMEAIGRGEKELDALARDLHIRIDELSESVMLLELSGHIVRNGNMIARTAL